MINYNGCIIEDLSVHQVGNKANDEELKTSQKSLDVADEGLSEILLNYFLKSFDTEEFYNFTFSGGEIELNPLFQYSSSLFEDSIPFHENSIKIAQ